MTDKLKNFYEDPNEIPEAYRPLFDDEGRLTGIDGVKTQADVDNVTKVNKKEREKSKGLEKNLGAYSQFGTPEEIQSQLDSYAILQDRQADANVDDATKEADKEKAEKNFKNRLDLHTTPFKKEIEKYQVKEAEYIKTITQIEQSRKKEKIINVLTAEVAKAKMLPGVTKDVIRFHDEFSIDDDGKIEHKESTLSPAEWVDKQREDRSYWWAPSQGSGASGSSASIGHDGPNPFDKEINNLTEQLKIKAKDIKLYDRLKAAAK